MMKTANSLLMDLEEQMNMIGLPLMALKLDELYRSSDFLTMDRLEMVSSLLKPEYEDKTTKRFNNRLRTAHLIGTPCDISQCRTLPSVDMSRPMHRKYCQPSSLLRMV